jgi:ubiquinone/menaquinone biosynthesis C-methylase UbiE
MSQADRLMARAFDDLSESYDDAHHDAIARALVAFLSPAATESVVDVACGTGAVAIAVAQERRPHPGSPPVLAIDVSAGMVAAGRARAQSLGSAAAIDWRIGPALPLPVADDSVDVILCASSLHFLGVRAPADWRRALRPGGRVGFTLPVASQFRPRGVLADLVADDLDLPETAEEGRALARDAGFTDTAARVVGVGLRAVVLVVGKAPTAVA